MGGTDTENGNDKVEAEPKLPIISFSNLKTSLETIFKRCFEENLDFSNFETVYKELQSHDPENKKFAVDQIFRDYLTSNLLPPDQAVDIPACNRYVQLTIQAARSNLCSSITPIQVLCDMFDVLTLAHCQQLFKVVESEVDTWREPVFFTACKNYLLRICNDLLRRLSRTQNTVFCGRILLFLAKFFPFSERSGLNVISEFNLDNHTTYSKREPKPSPPKVAEEDGDKESIDKEKDLEGAEDKKCEDEQESEKKPDTVAAPSDDCNNASETQTEENKDVKEEKTTREKLNEVIDEELRNLAVDEEYEEYAKFWQIQDFFRNPVQCYEKGPWKTFSSQLTEILSIFQKNKLYISQKDKKNGDESTEDRFDENMEIDGDTSISETKYEDHQYFAKYLTNQNLFQLQLSDSNFRRYVLIQALILFQYLQTNIKFKTDRQVLASEQLKWLDDQRRKVYKLMAETPPMGPQFVSAVKHLMKRELAWIKWKNDGCPVFTAKNTASEGKRLEELKSSGPRKRKASTGDQMKKEVAMKKVNLGNRGLNKLWSVNPHNLESCRERKGFPSLENYFEDAILELDPANQVEEQYRKVNNGEWGYRALRLMSRKSPHFFISGNNPISKLTAYLEMMMGKISKDMPHLAPKVTESGTEEMAVDGENGETNEDEKPSVITADQITALAEKLVSHWRSIVPKLGLPEEKVEEIQKKEGDEAICRGLLECWLDMEGEGATHDEMKYILEGLQLAHIAEEVF